MKKVSRERVGSELEGMLNGMVAAWLLCHVCILQNDCVCIVQHDINYELPIARGYLPRIAHVPSSARLTARNTPLFGNEQIETSGL